MTGQYGRGEVDDRIALARRTSAELDASVRAYCDADDFEPAVCDVCGLDVHTREELAACLDSALFQPDEPEDDEPDGHDSWERLMWLTHPPRPEPYMDGCRLRYD